MATAQFDWLGWLSTPEKNHRLYLHKIRDGAAFAEILALLSKGGYDYRELQLNVARGSRRRPIQRSADLLVMVTRPPLDEDVKKPIQRSNSQLENAVMSVIRPYFEKCSRNHIMLQSCTARLLKHDFSDHAEIVFQQYADWAWYKRLRGMAKDLDDSNPRTAAFLVFIPKRSPSLPALLAIFGMGGNDTLLWARLLRERYFDNVLEILRSETAHFLMAELSPGNNKEAMEPISQCEALDDIARSWKVTIIANGNPK